MDAAGSEALLQAFPHPVLVVDGNLQVLAANRRAQALFGRRVRDRQPDPLDGVGRALLAEPDLADRLTEAAAQSSGSADEVVFGWRQTGRQFAVSVSAMTGSGEAYLAVFTDTTAGALSDDIQHTARRYLEQVLDDIPVGVVVLGPDLRLTLMNRQQERFFGQFGRPLTLVDGVGLRLDQLLPDGPGADWHALAERVVADGARLGPMRQALGTELVLAVAFSPLRDHHGRGWGVILTCQDVTAQARLEEELIRIEKLATVGQMVVTVNHEINNPLSIIAANAQTLRLTRRDLDERALAKLLVIEEQVRRIAAVTERLRQMDQVATRSYIQAGPAMIDVWGDPPTGADAPDAAPRSCP
jgi:nitrogen-specific signal transduction histidine kinase